MCARLHVPKIRMDILVVVVHIIRYVSTCTISRLSKIPNVILSLQVNTIINYKINCQNVGTKTDGVDEIVSPFSRHWTESLCQITWWKIIAMCKNTFKLFLNLMKAFFHDVDVKFNFCIWNFVHSLRVSASILRYFKETHFEFRLHLKRYNEQK